MITKGEAAQIVKNIDKGKMSWEQILQQYPKVSMVIEYIFKHYPDDKDKICQHKMLVPMIFGDYSNTQIENMIDKLAIFNGWTKYMPERVESE